MDGRTALHLASGNGHSEVVKELIAAGAKVDVQDKMIAFLRTVFNEEEWNDVSRSLRGLPDDTTLLTLEKLPMWALPVRVPSPELYRRVQDLVRARHNVYFPDKKMPHVNI
ncbi:hypothetical protein DIPPA_20965 [Diplonema papillatum]|nr:hypothetical protein DIPPA_20965 [Diplonema papillatum]